MTFIQSHIVNVDESAIWPVLGTCIFHKIWLCHSLSICKTKDSILLLTDGMLFFKLCKLIFTPFYHTTSHFYSYEERSKTDQLYRRSQTTERIGIKTIVLIPIHRRHFAAR